MNASSEVLWVTSANQINIPTEWKMVVSILTFVAFIFIILLSVCILKRKSGINRDKDVLPRCEEKNASALRNSINFPMPFMSSPEKQLSSKHYEKNLISHGLFPLGGKNIYKGKKEDLTQILWVNECP